MIVKIMYGQPQIKVRLSTGAEDPDFYKQFIFVIKPVTELPCDFVRPSVWNVHGCWPEYRGPRHTAPPELPSLMYPAFDIDCDGAIIFLLDNKLERLPPGRYIGEFVTKHGAVVGTIDIDLNPMPYVIRQLEVVEGVQTCEK